MKIFLTGKNGQVGFALEKKLSNLGEVISTDRSELNLADSDAIRSFIDKVQPDIIINPAAYTLVDKAESEPELCYKINAIAPKVLAEKAYELDIPMIHFSTDYIFDGLKKESYLETDQANPQSVYGQTKWVGEEAVRLYSKHIILRTSWIFSYHGQNFLKTILKLIQEKSSLNVVSDQIGTPTSTDLIADITYKVIKAILNNPNFIDFGTYHVTSKSDTDWYHYAYFITNEAIQLGLKTTMTSLDIKAILSHDYPTPAKRPFNSKLCADKIQKTFMLELPHWESEVKKVLKELISLHD